MASRDRPATEKRLFDAAAEEFAREGIGGARIERIAQNARANRALIYTYFGDKEELFSHVLSTKLRELAETVVVDPANLPNYVADLFDYLTAHPDMARFIQHEGMRYTTKPIPNFDERRDAQLERIEHIAEGQAHGDVDPTLNPGVVFFILTAMVNWYFAAPQSVAMSFGDPESDETRQLYRGHIIAAARRLIEAPS